MTMPAPHIPPTNPPPVPPRPCVITVELSPCCGAMPGDVCDCAQDFAEMVAAMASPLRFGWTR